MYKKSDYYSKVFPLVSSSFSLFLARFNIFQVKFFVTMCKSTLNEARIALSVRNDRDSKCSFLSPCLPSWLITSTFNSPSKKRQKKKKKNSNYFTTSCMPNTEHFFKSVWQKYYNTILIWGNWDWETLPKVN